MTYAHALSVAVDVALEAGARLRTEFHRPGGPRGTPGHATIDGEVEQHIRDVLGAAFPEHGIRGEELGEQDRVPGPGETHFWLIDPNDGTSAMQSGFRGASVSIALIRGDTPVLGVIYAYAAPDDTGDLLAWAEGCGPLTRNGQAVPPREWPTALTTEHTVLISQHADQKSDDNARWVAPARFRPAAGIAYRLALVAAGEGVAAVSLFVPRDYDYAAGHALLRGVGGELLDVDAKPVRYRTDRITSTPYCFGGGVEIGRDLARRDWNELLRRPRTAQVAYDLVWPSIGGLTTEHDRLVRAQGAMLGQLVGDALGSLVEFMGAADIAAAHPSGPFTLFDGGTHNTLAGQPTDDSEMALLLIRGIVANGGYSDAVAAEAYVAWLASGPFDVGGTIGQALRAGRGDPRPETLRAAASRDSQANGALMRISPVGILGHAVAPEVVSAWARADAALTHPNAICGDCNAIFCATLAHAIATGAKGRTLYDFAVEQAAGLENQTAATWLAEAESPLPADLSRQMGWVRWAFTATFHHVLKETPFEAALVDVIRRGGDTDTNAAIVGAMLGAVQGRAAIPAQWRERVLTCRPVQGLQGVHKPRPRSFWPVDALVLAERLLVLGRAAAET